MIGPFFNKQYMNDIPDFSGFLCERPHFSDILVYAHIFLLRDFLRLFVLLVFNELTVIFV